MEVTEQNENERTVTRFTTKVWNEGDLDALTDLAASDIAAHIPGVPEVQGREAYGEAVQLYRSAFPDFSVELVDTIAADDTVVVRYTVRGTHEGELMGVAPTGSKVEVPGIAILRFEGGKVVEEWNQGDMLGLLQQIGAVPEQPAA